MNVPCPTCGGTPCREGCYPRTAQTKKDCPYLGTRCDTGESLTADEYTNHMQNRHDQTVRHTSPRNDLVVNVSETIVDLRLVAAAPEMQQTIRDLLLWIKIKQVDEDGPVTKARALLARIEAEK